MHIPSFFYHPAPAAADVFTYAGSAVLVWLGVALAAVPPIDLGQLNTVLVTLTGLVMGAGGLVMSWKKMKLEEITSKLQETVEELEAARQERIKLQAQTEAQKEEIKELRHGVRDVKQTIAYAEELKRATPDPDPEPRKVIVVNDAAHPVPTEDQARIAAPGAARE